MRLLNLEKIGVRPPNQLSLIEFDRTIHMRYAPDLMSLDEELESINKPFNEGTFNDTSYGKISYEKYIDLMTRDGWRVYIALLGDACIGYVHTVPGMYKDSLYVSSFIITKEFTGKGYGKEMMKLLIGIGKKKYSILIVQTALKNAPAVNLYKRSGFTATHQTMIKRI